MGELILEELLKQILPGKHFMLQHGFRNGCKVDAVIMLEQVHVGTTREGGLFELPHYTVTVRGRSGRIGHVDMFDLEDLDAAQASFDAAVANERA